MEHTDLSGEKIGEATVLDGMKKPVRLSSLWKEKTAVLVFVRHFG